MRKSLHIVFAALVILTVAGSEIGFPSNVVHVCDIQVRRSRVVVEASTVILAPDRA